jgi:hypothetical protein
MSSGSSDKTFTSVAVGSCELANKPFRTSIAVSANKTAAEIAIRRCHETLRMMIPL